MAEDWLDDDLTGHDPLERAGLDTFAARTPSGDLSDADRRAFEEADIRLAHGLFSVNGGSFRGRLYATLVSYITGVSLHQRWIPPSVVREMHIRLDGCDPGKVLQDMKKEVWRSRDYTPEDIAELRRFFAICAERGLGLVGWF
jgi:hypothetical protein